MEIKKPSRPIFAFMILAVTAIICAFIFKNGSPIQFKIANKTETKLVNPQIIASATNSVDEQKDTDSDGLFDWEEALWGTSIDNPDTDNDKTSDGDEVKQERNPTVPAPGDSMKEATDTSVSDNNLDSDESSNINSKNTISSEVSKNLLTRLMTLKQNDTLTPENKQALINDLTQFTMGSFTYKKYTKDSMLFIENPTPEEIKVYASNFATIQDDLLTSIARKGNAIMQDTRVLSEIYENSAKKMSEIAIPRILADVHLNVVNNYSAASKAIEASSDDSDPAKKAVAIGAYQNATANQEQSINILANYFKQSGIIFTSDQAGNYWNNF